MATIKDVAEQAKVSRSTVSYALSGKRPISGAVKARVDEAIRDLGYAPSVLATGLRRGRSHTIGLIYPLPDPSWEWVGLDFIAAAAEAIQETHTLSLLTHLNAPGALLDSYNHKMVDGLILMQIAQDDPRVAALRAGPYPFSLIGRPADTTSLSIVDFDYESAVVVALSHLFDLGHRRIGLIDFPQQHRNQRLSFTLYLKRGYDRAAKALGLTLVRQEAGPSIDDGYHATAALLATEPALSAVFALSGSTQVGALRALQAAGREVPRDCSLICISTARGAEWSTPRLTSIDFPLAEMGRLAAELLVERLSGVSVAKQLILPAKLTLRESTAPPPL